MKAQKGTEMMKVDLKKLKRFCLESPEVLLKDYGMTDLGRCWYRAGRKHKSVTLVAHSDTVFGSDVRVVPTILNDGNKSNLDGDNFEVSTYNGVDVVTSSALDDRLGCFMALEMIKQLGISPTIVITDGEETGQTTITQYVAAVDQGIVPKPGILIELDRRGADFVTYSFHNAEVELFLENLGIPEGNGSFSDISRAKALNVFGFNLGITYQKEHSLKCCMNVPSFLARCELLKVIVKQLSTKTYVNEEVVYDQRCKWAGWKQPDDKYDDYSEYWLPSPIAIPDYSRQNDDAADLEILHLEMKDRMYKIDSYSAKGATYSQIIETFDPDGIELTIQIKVKLIVDKGDYTIVHSKATVLAAQQNSKPVAYKDTYNLAKEYLDCEVFDLQETLGMICKC